MSLTEAHPYFQEEELKEFLAKEDIAIQAWYPLGHGDKALLEESVFTRLAEKHGKSKDKHQLKGYMDRLQDEKVENEHNN
ncbi:MAG: hypothetical protein SO023_01755 [Eubacterium sp.]|nr:hypothetical protein [Eubacterium sp.]